MLEFSTPLVNLRGGRESDCVESIVIHCAFDQTYKMAYHPKQKPRRGVGLRQINTYAAKYLYWSIFKKSRHLGFGVFIDIWSLVPPNAGAALCFDIYSISVG
jgi:hypothetical protein